MKELSWNYVNYVVKPYLDNPEMKVVNVNISEDENGITTLVVHIAPVIEKKPEQTVPYAEGKL